MAPQPDGETPAAPASVAASPEPRDGALHSSVTHTPASQSNSPSAISMSSTSQAARSWVLRSNSLRSTTRSRQPATRRTCGSKDSARRRFDSVPGHHPSNSMIRMRFRALPADYRRRPADEDVSPQVHDPYSGSRLELHLCLRHRRPGPSSLMDLRALASLASERDLRSITPQPKRCGIPVWQRDWVPVSFAAGWLASDLQVTSSRVSDQLGTGLSPGFGFKPVHSSESKERRHAGRLVQPCLQGAVTHVSLYPASDPLLVARLGDQSWTPVDSQIFQPEQCRQIRGKGSP